MRHFFKNGTSSITGSRLREKLLQVGADPEFVIELCDESDTFIGGAFISCLDNGDLMKVLGWKGEQKASKMCTIVMSREGNAVSYVMWGWHT